jgi:hypothetical protein
MRLRALFVAAMVAALALCLTATTASAADVELPRKHAPAWFTEDFRQQVDAAGTEGVPLDDHSALDVCPGAVLHEGGVGTGTCLVYPYGCTANFVYYNGGGATAPAVSDGSLYLGSAGHCSDKAGEPVYAAISTPGVGPAIAKIGTISKRVDDYPDSGNVHDFESIQIDPGYQVYPESPVGGPQGIYDGCEVGQPLKYYGHGYEVAVAQGKPEGGVATHWYDDGYGWAGPAFGGDSGSGVLHAGTDQAVGNLTAVALIYPPFFPGETIGSRVTWILSFLGAGYSLVNADGTLSRDTDSPCGTAETEQASGGNGGGGKGGGKGNGKGGKPKA